MPQYWGMLESQDRHVYAAGRYLYTPVRILRRTEGPSAANRFEEPQRVAEAVATLGLKHAVVTSVNRDDDNIGSARVFAETIRAIRELTPDCRVEVLIPDFQGLEESLRIVLDAQPDVLNHNTETVPRLYRSVRSGARYERTLTLLEMPRDSLQQR